MRERHPSAEILAAYTEGKLRSEEREDVSAHLLACGECYELVKEVAALREELEAETPHAKAGVLLHRRRAVIALAAAAALAILLFGAPLVERQFGRGSDPSIRALAAAVSDERPIEPQIASFGWAPLRPVMRGGATDRYELLAAAAKIEKEAADDPSPRTAHRLGVARLLLGEWEEAIDLITRAAEEEPTAARWSDLAAAKLARGIATGERSDLLAGYEHASHALTIDPSHRPALFNRALALHRSGMDPEAAERAWSEYLSADPSSGWADEARARLQELTIGRDDQGTGGASDLLRNLETEDDAAAAAAVDRHPQQARLLFEEELLGSWGNHWLAGEGAEARSRLAAAARLADILGARGDPAPARTLEALRNGSPSRLSSFARGYVLYSNARKAYRDHDYSRAHAAAREALPLLAGTPHESLTSLLLASIAYVRREASEAEERLLGVERNAGFSPSIDGQAEWIRGLLLIHEGRSFAALEPLRRSVRRFEQLGERANAAAAETLVAFALEELGERRQAFDAQVRGTFDTVYAEPSAARRHTALFGLSEMAQRRGMPHLAVLFSSRVLEEAEEAAKPERAVDALRVRAAARADLRDAAGAVADLERARGEVRKIPDERIRERTLLFIDSAAAEALAELYPEEALAAADRALGRSEALGDPLRLAEVQLTRGKLLRRSGDLAGAERALRSGLGQIGRAGDPITDPRLRLSHHDTAGELVDTLAVLLVDGGRAEEAHHLVVASRSRPFGPDLPAAPEPTDESATLSWVVLEDQTILWSSRAGRIDAHRIAAGADELERLVEHFAGDVTDRRLAARLHQLLIEPATDAISSASVLRLSPDGPLHALPFAALQDAAGKHLVVRHAVVIAHSPGRCCQVETALSDREVLIVGNPRIPPEVGSLPDLPGSAAEAEAIASYYPNAEALTGSSASAERFTKMAPRASRIHFGGHAIPHLDRPEDSLLVLAESERQDGLLTASELMSIPLRSDAVVVLAGCRSAVGPVGSLSGMDGLARAVLVAGASAVVASLADLDDRASSRVLIEFHRRLASGERPEEAFRGAQLAADRSGIPPTAWASLQLFVR